MSLHRVWSTREGGAASGEARLERSAEAVHVVQDQQPRARRDARLLQRPAPRTHRAQPSLVEQSWVQRFSTKRKWPGRDVLGHLNLKYADRAGVKHRGRLKTRGGWHELFACDTSRRAPLASARMRAASVQPLCQRAAPVVPQHDGGVRQHRLLQVLLIFLRPQQLPPSEPSKGGTGDHRLWPRCSAVHPADQGPLGWQRGRKPRCSQCSSAHRNMPPEAAMSRPAPIGFVA